MVTNVPVDIRVHNVLSWRRERAERGTEFFPVARAIDQISAVGIIEFWVERSPTQRVTL